MQYYFIPIANNYLNTTFENMNLIFGFNDFYMDNSVIESPKVINNSIEASFNSTIFTNKTVFSSKTSSVIPHIIETDKQIEVYLNQYVVNSALASLQDSNKLNFYIKGDSLNASSIIINTTYLGILIPDLIAKYGNDKIIDINCTSNKVPLLEINANTSSGLLYSDCDFIVNINSTSKENAFTASISTHVILTVFLTKGLLKGEFQKLSIESLSVSNSTVGIINTFLLQNLINLGLGGSLTSINTMVFNDGMLIPSAYGLSFNETDLNLKQGYAQLDMNVVIDNKKLTRLNLR